MNSVKSKKNHQRFGGKVRRQCSCKLRGMANHLHSGFTLVETIVSVSMAGILLSLTLVGVQHAMEASRRSQYSNHLRQIPIAVGSFEATQQIFFHAWPITDQNSPPASTSGDWVFRGVKYKPRQNLKVFP